MCLNRVRRLLSRRSCLILRGEPTCPGLSRARLSSGGLARLLSSLLRVPRGRVFDSFREVPRARCKLRLGLRRGGRGLDRLIARV
jgi:hypothetical protein